MFATLLSTLVFAAQPLPTVVVDRDNVEITESCLVQVTAPFIVDHDGNGVVHIKGDDLDVRFDRRPLRGAPPDREPDAYEGVGIRIVGRNVRLSGGRVSGFRVGIHASGVDGLTINGADVSDNFRQRLASTVSAEDSGDWLWPHANDENEWLTNYGAGLYIEDADDVTVTSVTCHNGQNGIILDRVNGSRVYDNRCTYLSGWGLALWRSSDNVVCRNAFDFCVRGYSHGVYNRGQDSAGILLFEQCSRNTIAENSATHCGDGLFAFAGREALGEVNPRDDLAWYRRRGNNDNLIIGNDFSDCVAHGLELTFSFGNRIIDNRLNRNAICGIWGGYSQDTLIAGNEITQNGDRGYGAERGGINIEHGAGNRIQQNEFAGNRCAAHLWWDEDEKLLATPWARANERGSTDNLVAGNRSDGDEVFLHLRRTGGVTRVGANAITNSPAPIVRDDESPVESVTAPETYDRPDYEILGTRPTVGPHPDRGGRERIVMTAWGPYDWSAPRAIFDGYGVDDAGRPTMSWRLLGRDDAESAAGPHHGLRAHHDAGVDTRISGGDAPGVLATLEATARAPGVHPVRMEFRPGDGPGQEERRLLVWTEWSVRFFSSPVDPREDAVAWRRGADDAVVNLLGRLDESFGGGGPRFPDAGGVPLPADHFGTIATTTLEIPPGRWRLRTKSDDGIRVWIDDDLVIDDWTWHPPREHSYDWTVDATRAHRLRVEHFELDGHAVLSVDLEPR